MSHSSVMLIHENDEDSIMGKRTYDSDENDGAEIEFECEKTVQEMEEEYEQDADKEEYPTLEDYAKSYYGYTLNEDKTEYGYYTNVLGMCDYYSVGGRWSNLLPDRIDKKLKALYYRTLSMKNKKGIELFRNDADFYMKVSEMPFREACASMGIGGCDSMVISKEIPIESILERFKGVYKSEGQDITGDIISAVIYDCILVEEDGEEISEANTTENFIEKYNHFLKRNEEEGREFKITILDLHS